MLNKIDEIFSTSGRDKEEKIIINYALGEKLPFHLTALQDYPCHLFCFISLYCLDCVELLPHLKKISERFVGQFILFTDATREENLALAQHFGFAFTLHACTKEDFASKYRISLTPYLYLLDDHATVIAAHNIQNIEEFKKVLHHRNLLRQTEGKG